MCGIAGILNVRRSAPTITTHDLKAMAKSFRHRGPDDEGIFCDARVGFAFRRLSILDLTSAGHQPMKAKDGKAIIVFNGEIYNFRELSQELKKLGYRFHSRTDTEVILHAYDAWGEACVQKFNGMFAFALYDAAKQKVFFARDHFGIKPFYYLLTPDRLIFGSEIKAILAVKGIRAALNHEALQEYFVFQNIFSDQTLFVGIRMLAPGHTMTVNLETETVKNEEYWDPQHRPQETLTRDEAVQKLRAIFRRAIKRHLIADVPVGSQLSGGIDSGSIVVAAAAENPHLMTFTAGFDTRLASDLEMNYDERALAESVAQHVQTSHYGMVIRPGDFEKILSELIWHLEDLRVGNSYPQYYINQLASRFVKVALSGTGGDELFGGYHWRYRQVANAANPAAFDRVYYAYWNRLLKDQDRKEFFTPEVWQHGGHVEPFAVYRSIISRVENEDPITKALYFDLKTFLHGLLVVEDKVSSAHGLEIRVPFLDRELVDFALQLPHAWKITPQQGKQILRDAVAPWMPKEILQVKKQGFSAPEQHWFRDSLREHLETLLLGPDARIGAYIRRPAIELILREHSNGRHNHRLMIWSLASFEWWLRHFLHPA